MDYKNFSTRSNDRTTCANCSRFGNHFYECNICHESFYCSSSCKRAHSEIHERDEYCNKIKRNMPKKEEKPNLIWKLLISFK